MPYRTNQNTPVDPETLRPTVQGFWRKLSYKHSGFINLCREQWFRETCGGVWLNSEHYYNEAVNHHSEVVKGASGLGAWPTRSDKESQHELGCKMCEWIPLIPVEGKSGNYTLSMDHRDREHLMFIVRPDLRRMKMLYWPYKSKDCISLVEPSLPVDKDRIECYRWNLKLDKAFTFEPCLEALLGNWPDFWQLHKLGIITK